MDIHQLHIDTPMITRDGQEVILQELRFGLLHSFIPKELRRTNYEEIISVKNNIDNYYQQGLITFLFKLDKNPIKRKFFIKIYQGIRTEVARLLKDEVIFVIDPAEHQLFILMMKDLYLSIH